MIAFYLNLACIVIGIIVIIASVIIGSFFAHIILFDSLLFALIAGLLGHIYFNIHPAICLLIGVVLLVLLFWLQNTQYGFWIIGLSFSVGWAFIFALVSYGITNGDKIWFGVILLLTLVMMIGLHIKARDSI